MFTIEDSAKDVIWAVYQNNPARVEVGNASCLPWKK